MMIFEEMGIRNNVYILACSIAVSLFGLLGIWGASMAQEDEAPQFTIYLPNMMDKHTPGELPDNSASEGNYYVSRRGDNSSGETWSSAWNELDQIDWELIKPGDTIHIDGGSNSMTYETSIEVAKSGAEDNPITIQLSTDSGRDGQAIFFGGRIEELPYCFQKDYTFTPSKHTYGIYINNHDWIVIEGQKWSGFKMHGYGSNAIRINHDSNDLLIRHVEAYDNGTPEFLNGSWNMDQPGIRVAGKNVTFERILVHDNGQDAFQSLFGENNIENLTIRQTWIYNLRIHPNGPESFNFCTHSDGFQIYDGGETQDILIEESIIGPGLTQGLLMGQTPNGPGSPSAEVSNVILRNVLAIKAADNNIVGYRDTNSMNWTIDRVTFHCPNTKGFCLRLNGKGHVMLDSIVYDGLIDFLDEDALVSGNCVWGDSRESDDIGEVVDPQFIDVSDDPFSLDDYSMGEASPCKNKGSSITSVEMLLNLPDPRK